MEIVNKDWNWPHPLQTRTATTYCIWHHTACQDQMQDTQAIWDEHVRIGDNGIGYNRVIKGDGTTVQGRPDWAVCAAAHGLNYCSVNIVVEGNFEASESDQMPTRDQRQAIRDNAADINAKYPGVIHVGHWQVAGISGDPGDATLCPGSTFISMFDELIGGVAA